MPRGGNLRRLLRDNPRLSYAALLLNAMAQDTSAEGQAFHAESDRLYARYKRLVAAIVKYHVSGWGAGGAPALEHIEHYFDTLLIAMPVRYPRPKPLSEEHAAAADWRRRMADAACMKAYARFVTGAGEAARRDRMRFDAVHDGVWSWALAIERSVNPVFQTRESRRTIVRRYLHDVTEFCERWRLRAPWARAAMIDYHFARARFGVDTFVPFIQSASWGEEAAMVVQVPGTDSVIYARDRERFVDVRSYSRVEGRPTIMVNATPTQAEQRTYEREQGASCVVVRFEPAWGISGATAPRAYVVGECEFRLRRPLRKREVRALSKELDPQMRAIRERSQRLGWHIRSDALATAHARWLGRKLLGAYSWNGLTRSLHDDPDAPGDARLLRRACTSFARRAGLSLGPPIRTASGHRH